jgi:hypothetical protein
MRILSIIAPARFREGLIFYLLFLLVAGVLLAGCSQSQQFSNCPCTCVPTTTSATNTTINATIATPAVQTQAEPATPVTGTPVMVTPAVPLSFQAVPLIFTPSDQLGTCSRYENVRTAPCNSFFVWPDFDFSYRGSSFPITIPYNTGAYQALKYNLSKMDEQVKKDYYENKIGNYTYGGIGANLPSEVIFNYYSSMINDPAQDATYNYLINYTRKIRDQNHLDDNEYAEMITLFVQRAIPYTEDPDRMTDKYPIETIGDLGGDSVDKSLLLAGLLSREGYGTALIWFPSSNHMVVGVLGDHQALEYGGYLGAETTEESYLGFYHTKNTLIYPSSVSTEYMADFQVIPISEGKAFTAGKELNFIWDQWALRKSFEGAEPYSECQYANDVMFITTNMDNRHLVYQYLTKTGNFQ